MSDSAFWPHLEAQFRSLQTQGGSALRANWLSTAWNEKGDHYYLSGTRGGKEGRRVHARYKWLAEKAAVRLGHRGGPSALFFWLDRLKSESPNFRGGITLDYFPTQDGPPTHASGGVIEQVCEASADYCLKCEVEETIKRKTWSARTAPAKKPEGFSQSGEYTVVALRGQRWTLTSRQAQMIQILHKAHESGKPDVRIDYILEGLGTRNSRWQDTWKSNREARKALIKSGQRKGTLRLNL